MIVSPIGQARRHLPLRLSEETLGRADYSTNAIPVTLPYAFAAPSPPFENFLCASPRKPAKPSSQKQMTAMVLGTEAGSDLGLVGRARDGDREAFGRLIERHYDFIHRVAWRWAGNRHDAEDIAQ